jgi:hypothetical protein
MSNIHKIRAGLDSSVNTDARRARWCQQEWPDTIQAPRRIPFERIAHRTRRMRKVRNLFLWLCITWTLFCIVLAAAAVLVS